MRGQNLIFTWLSKDQAKLERSKIDSNVSRNARSSHWNLLQFPACTWPALTPSGSSDSPFNGLTVDKKALLEGRMLESA